MNKRLMKIEKSEEGQNPTRDGNRRQKSNHGWRMEGSELEATGACERGPEEEKSRSSGGRGGQRKNDQAEWKGRRVEILR